MRVMIIFVVVIVAVLGIGFITLRLVAAKADNTGTAPEDMVERYATAAGVTYYRINAGINNAYLVPCDGGWLLIDTGYPDDYERFKKALAYLGIQTDLIKFLFITHAHDEHAGFAAALIRDTGCRLIVSRLSIPELEAGQMVWNGKAINRRIAAAAFLYNSVKRRDMRFPPLTIGDDDIELEGDCDARSTCPGLTGRFVATPGHSPDSYSLVMDDGSAFVGDAAMNYLNWLGADHRPIFVTDEEETRASIERVLSLGAKRLYTGHGPAFESDDMRAAIQRHKKGGA